VERKRIEYDLFGGKTKALEKLDYKQNATTIRLDLLKFRKTGFDLTQEVIGILKEEDF
jgi:hypothetical protein